MRLTNTAAAVAFVASLVGCAPVARNATSRKLDPGPAEAGENAVDEAPANARDSQALGIWRDFVAELRADRLEAQEFRPLMEPLRAPMLGFLQQIRDGTSPDDWNRDPEVHRDGDRLIFVMTLGSQSEKNTFVFSFVREVDLWHFQHLESIFLRLDRVTPPATDFPDVGKEKKAWMRQEIAWTERLRLFAWLLKEKGRVFALDWFKDGAGYALAAKTWVPLVPAHRAFVLYACWEQSKLRGGQVELQELSDSKAVVSLRPLDLLLYERTGHFRRLVSKEDFVALFESIWQDRAMHGGWTLAMNCEAQECELVFTRS